eukprot:NODE_12079_length_1247_cov_5.088393.p2 GENE.NODE_12079_length_1247_cov_5.088393~~NODE_12079_length_1247_cov_5.088393.p2  ORF type:complete len:203 (-),score=36.98 NODE_12079_length_1247_cov_5.088393:296-904(-)
MLQSLVARVDSIEAVMWLAEKRLDDVAITATARVNDLQAVFMKDSAAAAERHRTLEQSLNTVGGAAMTLLRLNDGSTRPAATTGPGSGKHATVAPSVPSFAAPAGRSRTRGEFAVFPGQEMPTPANGTAVSAASATGATSFAAGVQSGRKKELIVVEPLMSPMPARSTSPDAVTDDIWHGRARRVGGVRSHVEDAEGSTHHF